MTSNDKITRSYRLAPQTLQKLDECMDYTKRNASCMVEASIDLMHQKVTKDRKTVARSGK